MQKSELIQLLEPDLLPELRQWASAHDSNFGLSPHLSNEYFPFDKWLEEEGPTSCRLSDEDDEDVALWTWKGWKLALRVYDRLSKDNELWMEFRPADMEVSWAPPCFMDPDDEG